MHLLHGGSQIRSSAADFPGIGIPGSLCKISEETPLHERFDVNGQSANNYLQLVTSWTRDQKVLERSVNTDLPVVLNILLQRTRNNIAWVNRYVQQSCKRSEAAKMQRSTLTNNVLLTVPSVSRCSALMIGCTSVPGVIYCSHKNLRF